MTISNQISKAGPYVGNGVTTALAVGFKFDTNAEVVGYRRNLTTGVDSLLVQGSDYTLTGAGLESGGVATMAVAPTANEYVVFLSTIPITQESDYIEASKFPAESHERALDKLTKLVRQLAEQVSRSLHFKPSLFSSTAQSENSELPDPANGQVLVWSGNKLINTAITDLGSDVSFINSAQVFASAATMRASFNPALSSYAATAGYVSAALGGGGFYDWNPASVATDDGFLVHAVTGYATGRLLLRPTGDKYSWLQAGVRNDGADCTTAKNVAINSGKNLFVPSGTYLCDGVKIVTNKQSITFDEAVTLKANANNVILFHQAADFAKHSGRFNTDSNGKTGVWGMACAPADLTQTTTYVNNNFNDMPGVFGDPGLDECIVLQCGPDVGGAESGCFYNNIPHSQAQGAKRGIWLKNASNANASSVNRNKFYDFRAGTFGGIGCNTGLQIDAGSTNSFFACDFEGVGSSSAAGPNAVPTAVKILAAAASSGADNNNNRFYSGTCEACTRDVDNANQYTEFYGFGFLDSNSLFTAKPLVAIGGTGPSANLLRLMGVEQKDGVNLELVDITDFADAGKKWQVYALTTTNVTHVGGASVTSISEYQSKFWQFSGMVHWSFRVQFRAASTTNDVLIELPVPEEINQYSLFSGIPEMRLGIILQASAGVEQVVAQFVAGTNQIRIPHTANWDIAGANNKIWCQCLIYHKA